MNHHAKNAQKAALVTNYIKAEVKANRTRHSRLPDRYGQFLPPTPAQVNRWYDVAKAEAYQIYGIKRTPEPRVAAIFAEWSYDAQVEEARKQTD